MLHICHPVNGEEARGVFVYFASEIAMLKGQNLNILW